MKLQTTHTDTQTNTLAATANIAYANKQNLRAFPPMDAHKRNNQGSFSIILFDLHYRPISNLAVGFILRVSLYCKLVWQWKITYIQTQIMGKPAMYRKNIYTLKKEFISVSNIIGKIRDTWFGDWLRFGTENPRIPQIPATRDDLFDKETNKSNKRRGL